MISKEIKRRYHLFRGCHMKFYERKDMEAFKKYENHIWESCNRLLNINAENHMIMCTLASKHTLDFLINVPVTLIGFLKFFLEVASCLRGMYIKV